MKFTYFSQYGFHHTYDSEKFTDGSPIPKGGIPSELLKTKSLRIIKSERPHYLSDEEIDKFLPDIKTMCHGSFKQDLHPPFWFGGKKAIILTDWLSNCWTLPVNGDIPDWHNFECNN